MTDPGNPELSLSPKQKRFCQQYLADLNATQAAIRAGYAKKWANTSAAHVMKLPAAKAYIEKLQAKLAASLEISNEKVLHELFHLAFCNVQDYFTENGRVADLSKISREKAAAIESIKVTETETKDGAIKTVWEFKLRNKLQALEKLGRHLGIFEIEDEIIYGETIVLKPIDPAGVQQEGRGIGDGEKYS